MAGVAKGNFGTYRKGEKSGYPSDEEAADDAVDTMFSMCGNAGQESFVGEVLPEFWDWALDILEDESSHRGSEWSEFVEMVINDWYDGDLRKWIGNTDQIWAEGWAQIAEQSFNHDSRDEQGEGTGNEFGQ